MTPDKKLRPGQATEAEQGTQGTPQGSGTTVPALIEAHWNCPGCPECGDLTNALARQVGVYTLSAADIEASDDPVHVVRSWLEEIGAALWGTDSRIGVRDEPPGVLR